MESDFGKPAEMEFEVAPAEAGVRLDRYLATRIPTSSRSSIERLIGEGLARVDGESAKPALRLRGGERISVTIPAPKELEIRPQEIPIDVLYEDDDLIAVDKPAGLVVHPAPGHPDSTLVNALLARVVGLSTVGDPSRPGIAHRLDRDTTGVVLVAKNDVAFREIARQITARTVRKLYVALVYGSFHETSGQIDRPLGRHPRDRKRMAVVPGGKPSLTRWQLKERLPRTSLLDVELVTGRTHQIRVHFASAGHPIVGDTQYGSPQWRGIPDRRLRCLLASFPRQALHAARLEIVHPVTRRPLVVEAPLPADLAGLLGALRTLANLG